MQGKITKSAVDAMKPGEVLADSQVKGFVARRLPSGIVSYGLRYRVNGKQRWFALGLHGQEITTEKARKLAKKRVGEVADDRDPAAERTAQRVKAKEQTNTVDALLDTFVERHVRRSLRSAREVERCFDKYVRPRVGALPVGELRRREIVEMLDAIEDAHGPVMCDRTLAYLRRAFNWHAARDDSFVPPIVRGMARTKASERARRRVLDDEEIRDLWTALDTAKVPEPFPRLVRALLLTAQRREEVAQMAWPEVDAQNRVWTVPGERCKSGEPSAVPLSDAAMTLLGKPKRHGFVFSTTSGTKSFSGYGKAKRSIDAMIAAVRKKEKREPMPHWVLHDLRRTARSLMSRAGVAPDVGERVLGHAIPGVRGTYDRHAYFEEKAHALDRLAALVERILDPNANVIALAGRRR